MLQLEQISVKRLARVHQGLATVVQETQRILPFSIRVTCGMRTLAEQVVLFEQGKSRTMKSKHLPQSDGFSHAVDLVAMIGGEPDWSSERFFEIAAHVRTAAIRCDVSVTWGGIWHPPLNEISETLPRFRTHYVSSFVRGNGRKPFFDAPHFQV